MRKAYTLAGVELHRLVAILTPPRARRGVWFVSRCTCGWSSPLCRLESLARKAHAKHAADMGDR